MGNGKESGEHRPVLLEPVIEWLDPQPGQSFIDCTVGNGGHAAAVLERTAPSGRLLGIDADPAAITVSSDRLASFGRRVVLEHANFRDLATVASSHDFPSVDGVLIDLGLSSRQLDVSGRGFSFRRDEPLDMRFDAEQGETAADLLNRLEERELADLLYAYADERRSRRVARAIVRQRTRAPLTTTADLVSAVEAALGPRRGRIHPATRTFQALRIAVNRELESLDAVLSQAAALLTVGGRLAVISFHSLEDRRVKQFFRGGGTGDAPLTALTRRPVTPAPEEITANPRARSAKLRVAERVGSPGAAS